MIYGEEETSLALEIGEILLRSQKRLATAESLTGGALGACLVSVSGSSNWYSGGIISYATELKEKLLGVNKKTIAEVGAVSERCVLEMAKGALETCQADFAISTSGVAGPNGDGSENPVGTVWLAVASKEKNLAQKFLFSGSREEVRRAAIREALLLFLKFIKQTN